MEKQLWMKEECTITMKDGTTKLGYRINFCRHMGLDENIEDINEGQEYQEVIEGSVVPDVVDQDYNDVEEYDDVNVDWETDPEFYVGDDNGKPM